MADRAIVVADDLHLDMARLADQPLDIDAVAAEGGLRLGLAARIGLLQLGGVLDDAHAAPAAAGDRLDHDRAAGAERGEECLCLVQRGRAAGALDDGHAAAFRQRLGRALSPNRSSASGDGPTKTIPSSAQRRASVRILAEKAVAGMQRVATGRLGGRDHRLDIEIGARAAPRNFAGSRRRRGRAATARRPAGGWRRWQGRPRRRRGRCEWRSRRDWRSGVCERA